MNLSRLAYRSQQFLRASLAPGKEVDETILRSFLPPPQIALFRRMQPSDQGHALRVYQRLRADGYTDPDLLAAALLHDVGKSLHPLSLWERVVIVLGKRLFPTAAQCWGKGQPQGLRRPFVVAARHAEWGADLAARAGASPRTVSLICHHQDSRPTGDPLLAALRRADESE